MSEATSASGTTYVDIGVQPGDGHVLTLRRGWFMSFSDAKELESITIQLPGALEVGATYTSAPLQASRIPPGTRADPDVPILLRPGEFIAWMLGNPVIRYMPGNAQGRAEVTVRRMNDASVRLHVVAHADLGDRWTFAIDDVIDVPIGSSLGADSD